MTLEQNYRSTQRSSLPPTRSSGSRAKRASPRTCGPTAPPREAAPRHGGRRDGAGRLHRRAHPGEPRGGARAQAAGGPVPHVAPLRPARSGAHAPQHPLRQVRRAEIPRRRARKGRAGGAALRRKSRDRGGGFRLLQLLPGVGPSTAGRIVDAVAAAGGSFDALAAATPPARGRTGLAGDRRHARGAALARLRLAAETRARAPVVRAAPRAHPRGRADAPADLLQLEQIAAGYPSRQRFSHRAHARSPGRDQRRGRRAAEGRGLPHPLHHPPRPRARNGRPSSCSTPSTAACLPTSHTAPTRRSRRSAGCSTWR